MHNPARRGYYRSLSASRNALRNPTLRYPNRKRLGRAGTRGLLLAFPRRSRDRTEFGLFKRMASDPLFTVA
jgi:hypothetical protein